MRRRSNVVDNHQERRALPEDITIVSPEELKRLVELQLEAFPSEESNIRAGQSVYETEVDTARRTYSEVRQRGQTELRERQEARAERIEWLKGAITEVEDLSKPLREQLATNEKAIAQKMSSVGMRYRGHSQDNIVDAVREHHGLKPDEDAEAKPQGIWQSLWVVIEVLLLGLLGLPTAMFLGVTIGMAFGFLSHSELQAGRLGFGEGRVLLLGLLAASLVLLIGYGLPLVARMLITSGEQETPKEAKVALSALLAVAIAIWVGEVAVEAIGLQEFFRQKALRVWRLDPDLRRLPFEQYLSTYMPMWKCWLLAGIFGSTYFFVKISLGIWGALKDVVSLRAKRKLEEVEREVRRKLEGTTPIRESLALADETVRIKDQIDNHDQRLADLRNELETLERSQPNVSPEMERELHNARRDLLTAINKANRLLSADIIVPRQSTT